MEINLYISPTKCHVSELDVFDVNHTPSWPPQ